MDDAGRDSGRHSLRHRPAARSLQRRTGTPVLAGAGSDEPRIRAVPFALHRQNEPGALLLGRTGFGGDAFLWPYCPQTSRWRAALRAARDVGGVLARSEQRWIL